MNKTNKINELMEQSNMGFKITLDQYRELDDREKFDLFNNCANEVKKTYINGELKKKPTKQDVIDTYFDFSSINRDMEGIAKWSQAEFQLIWIKKEEAQTFGFTQEEILALKELLKQSQQVAITTTNDKPFTNLDLNHPLMEGKEKSIGLHIPEKTLNAWKEYVKGSKLKQKDLLAYALIYFMENNPL